MRVGQAGKVEKQRGLFVSFVCSFVLYFLFLFACLHVLFCFGFFLFFFPEVAAGGMGDMEEWEVSRIVVHEVKFLTMQ